jgi:hypothetical protein
MIPIFVIVKDRIKVLEQSMESWLTLIKSPIEIILLDQESTYPGMIEWLEEKKKEGMRVFRLKNTSPTKANKFPALGGPVRQVCSEMNVLYYVLTDPDIMFETVSGDILEFYTYFLETNKSFDAVGPMLTIDDIPDHYPLKAEVIKRHTPFWEASGNYSVIGKPQLIKYKGNIIQYQVSPIDTTFALRRLGTPPVYTPNAIRTRQPYTAKHLDWYIDPNDLSEDQKYYIETSLTHKGISHWAGTWMRHPESLARASEKNTMPKKRQL